MAETPADEPTWLTSTLVRHLHRMLIAEHGGKAGVRDEALLESALNRARDKYHYQNPSWSDLAAAYAYGLARNHPFHDGNKRIAATSIAAFLGLQDLHFQTDERELVLMMEDLASGKISEEMLSEWIAENTTPSDAA